MTTLLPRDCWFEIINRTSMPTFGRMALTEKAGPFYYGCVSKAVLRSVQCEPADSFGRISTLDHEHPYPSHYESLKVPIYNWLPLAFSSLTDLAIYPEIATYLDTTVTNHIRQPIGKHMHLALWQEVLPQMRHLTSLKIPTIFILLPLGESFILTTHKSKRTLPSLKRLVLLSDATTNQIQERVANLSTLIIYSARTS